MNRNDFLNMIEDTVPVNRQMIGEVYELINVFPYFQSAHMLLLKGLQNNADVKFENQLRNSAIHIADREVLYYLLKIKTSPEIEQAKHEEEKELTEVLAYETQQTVIESGKNSEDLISEIEKNAGVTNPDEHQDNDNQNHGHSIVIATESDNEDSTGIMLILDDETSTSEDKVFFMDPGFSVPEQSNLLELDLDENKTIISDEVDMYPEPLNYWEKNSKKQLQSELIDKFIISNPRIEPLKEKTGLPVEDISPPFVEEEGVFITETLARIYIHQGYYSKAIDIYEKLSLKFPEKSSYFAFQIGKVKEYIK